MHSPEELLETAQAFQNSRILLAAYELGIFNALGPQTLASDEVARLIHCDPRGTDRLMNALCSLGLLQKNRGLFSNTPVSFRYLTDSSPDYLSGLGHTASLYRSWATLDSAVRKGTTVIERASSRSGEALENFIAAMHRSAKESAEHYSSLVELEGVHRLLDVGGGSGIYSIAFARKKIDLQAVVLDLPEVVKITRKYIKAAGMEDRVSVMPGDYLTDYFGNNYDLVYLSAIVHINSFEENRSLVKKAVESLNPGGRVVINDHVMNEDRSGPLQAAIFALNMLVNTKNGDTYTENEIRSWFDDAGCMDFKRIDTGQGTALLSAKKPL